MISNIYYKIDGNNIYYSNKGLVGYELKDNNDKVSEGKNVIIQPNGEGDYFGFPSNDGIPSVTSYLFYGATNVSFNDMDKWKFPNKLTTLRGMFQNCTNLTSIDLSDGDVSEVYDMTDMFNGCTSLTDINLSGGDTSKVSSMARMFKGCTAFESIGLDNWSMNKIETLEGMFQNCTNAQLISIKGGDFGTSDKYVSVNSMFEECTSLTCVNAYQTNFTNVNGADRVFYNDSNLIDVMVAENTNWYTDLKPSMKNMFYNCINIHNYDRTVNGETKANDGPGGYFRVGDVVPKYEAILYTKDSGRGSVPEIYEKFSGNGIRIEGVVTYNG